MARRATERRPAGLRPVERVEVPEKHLGRRLAAFAVCLAIGLAGLGYGVYSWLSADPGWVEIEADIGQSHCGGEFTFLYLLREGGLDANARLRQLRGAYNQACVEAYQLFTLYENFENVHNLCYINAHPNEEIVVDDTLYQAFALAEEHGDRAVYLGPVYSVYYDLFSCQEDSETQAWDPFVNPEMKAFCQELADFARDPAQVQVELLGNNTLRLRVSEEYQAYAKENGREYYLDFGWQRNAFIADFLAGELMLQGYADGMITSLDGYTRTLGGQLGEQVFTVYDWANGRNTMAAQTYFHSPTNAASLRTFPLYASDQEHGYSFEDGSLRHWFIDQEDGLCRAAVNALAVYSESASCAELALEAGAILIGGQLDPSALKALKAKEIHGMAVEGQTVLYTEKGLPLELYQGGELAYQEKYAG